MDLRYFSSFQDEAFVAKFLHGAYRAQAGYNRKGLNKRRRPSP